MPVADFLTRVRNKLSDRSRWTKGAWFRTRNGRNPGRTNLDHYQFPDKEIGSFCPPPPIPGSPNYKWTAVPSFNDSDKTTYEQVMDILDRSIHKAPETPTALVEVLA